MSSDAKPGGQKRSYEELEKDLKALQEELKEASKKAEEASKKAEEASKKAEEESKKAEEASKKAEEASKKAEEESALRVGTFYETFDKVWTLETTNYAQEDYADMIRKDFPNFNSREKKIVNPFLASFEAAIEKENVIKNDNASSRTSHNKERDRSRIWPAHVFEVYDDLPSTVDDLLEPAFEEAERIAADAEPQLLFGTKRLNDKEAPEFMAPDDTSAKEEDVVQSDDKSQTDDSKTEGKFVIPGDIAHLLPASPLHASLYSNVVIWLFGKKMDKNTNAEVLQRLIHGASNPATSGNDGKKERRRLPKTGVKHMICNKIRLNLQGTYFGKHPCLIIVPILSLEQTKSWSGQGYHAIALISDGGNHEQRIELKTAASSLLFTDKGELAEKEEIQLAGKLLAKTVKALAYSLTQMEPKNLNEESAYQNFLLTKNHAEKLDEIRKSFLANTLEGIIVPGSLGENLKPVRKITFASAKHESSHERHPAPDPILLSVKSAVNWSRYHSQPLLASGEVDSDDDMSERSILAMQEYLEMREVYAQAKREQELMNLVIDIPQDPAAGRC